MTALAPERYEGYLLKGINERHHGNIEDAIVYLGEAARRSDEVALPHLVLGRVLEEQGDTEGAMNAYAQAIRVEPENPDAQALYFDGQDRLLSAHPDASPE